MNKFEYKIVPGWHLDSENIINLLGDDGWELVTACERNVILKRIKQEVFKSNAAGSKVYCNICQDPNCSEPNQKH